MPTVYRKGRYWWCYGHYSDGSRWWASTKVPATEPKRVAERVARVIGRGRILESGQAPDACTLYEALELLRAAKVRKRRSEATMEILRDKGRQLVRILGKDRPIGTLELADTEAYLDRRRLEKVSDHTIAKELGHLREALNAARRQGRYQGQARDLWPDALVDVYTPRTRWLPVPEYTALLAVAYPGRRDDFIMYCHTGVRQSELGRILAEDVDPARRMVRVRGTKTAGADRWIPLSDDAWEVVERRLASHPTGPLFRPWGRQNMRQSLHRWCADAGIAPVSANDLRRTFCSWLCSAGSPEHITVKLMGHTSSRMVRLVYGHLSDEALALAIGRMPRVTSVSPNPSNRRDSVDA